MDDPGKVRRAKAGRRGTFFNANGGMVASTDPGWIQTAFDTLKVLFDRVVLGQNIQKTVGVVCQPFQAIGVQADKT